MPNKTCLVSTWNWETVSSNIKRVMIQLLSIMLGGALGAVMRYLLASGLSTWLGKDFPYGTLSVNIIGSFLMGLLTVLLIQKDFWGIDPAIKLAFTVGFLGAFTTFSTFSLDTFVLFEKGAVSLALFNIFISVFSCLAAVWLGILLGKQI